MHPSEKTQAEYSFNNLLRKHLRSYKYALRGLVLIFATQLNFRLEFVAAIGVVIAGVVFQIDTIEWIIIAFCIAIVLIAEGLNSAIEALSDAIVKEYSEDIRYAKDIGAGAVLLSTIVAAFVGLVIFAPYVVELFD
jgi:diacylglycerol kinase